MQRIAMVVVCLGFGRSIALADGDAPAAFVPPAAPPAASTTAAQPVAPSADVGDGLRLRHGISLSGGEEVGSGPSSGLSGSLYGLDWRIGVQINNLYAVYAQTHLSFGTAHIGGASGVTGDFAEALMAERTLADKFFVAAGGGYGVLNNPSGPLAQIRGGMYPMMTSSDTAARRKGLMIGVDARAYFAGAEVGTVTQIMLSVGYEKF